MGGAARVAVCAVLRKEKARNPTVSTTPEKKEKTIKIFVSHRIDLDSQTIDNPLFVNVRCGAVFDKRKNVTMLGDDTGENISERRNTFNELTVQYWAWKNQDADYYGLCHYRRYFAFENDPGAKRNDANHIVEKYLSEDAAEKYGMCDEERAREIITSYDLILAEPIDISKKSTPYGYKKTIMGHWLAHDRFLTRKIYIRWVLDILNQKYPDIYQHAQKYLNQNQYIGFHCYVMNKKLYNEYCEYLYSILFELEKRVSAQKDYDLKTSELVNRWAGYMGEILFGIFCSYVMEKRHASAHYLPLVYFENTEKPQELMPVAKKNNIPIILVSSAYYIPYVSCLIKSAVDHKNQDTVLDFIILNKDIAKEDKRKIQTMLGDRKDVSVRFYDMSRLVEERNFFISVPGQSEASYYRMLTPWALKNYDKAIVMDSDLVFEGDIANLYKENLREQYLGAVRDVVFQGTLNDPRQDNDRYSKHEMKMKEPFDYVNTGVMLMNLKKIRADFTAQYIAEYMEKHKMRIQEQDIVNMLFQGKIKYIDIKYNYYINLNPWLDEMLNYFGPFKAVEEYDKAEDGAVIYHWANHPKPWVDFNVPYAEKFWAVARKTPFYELILHRYISSAAVGAANAANLVCGEDPYNRFAFPWRSVRPGSRIVLYGGGVVGKMFLRQLANNPYCHVVAVCDQNPAGTGIREAPVIDVRQLCDLDPELYDLVLIDLERKDIAAEIRADLEPSGIPPQKIKWVDPHRR